MKVIQIADYFDELWQVQLDAAELELPKSDLKEFYKKSMRQYQKLTDLGVGEWFGAFVDGKLAGSLGIFYDGELARYQIVSTRPEFQRRGVCSTLVYESAQHAFGKGAKTLVMVADDDYHAAKIYESVGFKLTGMETGVCWYDKTRVGKDA